MSEIEKYLNEMERQVLILESMKIETFVIAKIKARCAEIRDTVNKGETVIIITGNLLK